MRSGGQTDERSDADVRIKIRTPNTQYVSGTYLDLT